MRYSARFTSVPSLFDAAAIRHLFVSDRPLCDENSASCRLVGSADAKSPRHRFWCTVIAQTHSAPHHSEHYFSRSSVSNPNCRVLMRVIKSCPLPLVQS
jgi:hypothetical protein